MCFSSGVHSCKITLRINDALSYLPGKFVPWKRSSFCYLLSHTLSKWCTYHWYELLDRTYITLCHATDESPSLPAQASHVVHITVLYNNLCMCVAGNAKIPAGRRKTCCLTQCLTGSQSQSGLRLRRGKMANCLSLSLCLASYLLDSSLSIFPCLNISP